MLNSFLFGALVSFSLLCSSSSRAQWVINRQSYDEQLNQYSYGCIDISHGLMIVAGHMLLPKSMGSGYAYIVERSTDEGETWSQASVSHAASRGFGFPLLRAIKMISPSIGICVGDSGLILRSSDAGLTWHKVDQTRNWRYLDVASPNGKTVYAVGGYGTVNISTDSGVTWTPKLNLAGTLFNSVVTPDDDNVYIADDYFCKVWHSSDKGQTWDTIVAATDLYDGQKGKLVRNISFIPPSTLLLIGGEKLPTAGFQPLVLRSDNLGSSWTSTLLPENGLQEELYAMCVRDSNVIVAGRGNLTYLSYDAGATWTVDSVTIDSSFELINDASFSKNNVSFYTATAAMKGYVFSRTPTSSVRSATAPSLSDVTDLDLDQVQVFDLLGREVQVRSWEALSQLKGAYFVITFPFPDSRKCIKLLMP